MEILGGQKIGIVGANGVGKTTLVETLVGNLRPYIGTVEKNDRIKVGYLSQSADELDPNASVLQCVQFGKISRAIAQSLLASLLITDETVHQKVATLS
jgi:ATPase subunit of ABC transporter with duplicated ATPase domains